MQTITALFVSAAYALLLAASLGVMAFALFFVTGAMESGLDRQDRELALGEETAGPSR